MQSTVRARPPNTYVQIFSVESVITSFVGKFLSHTQPVVKDWATESASQATCMRADVGHPTCWKLLVIDVHTLWREDAWAATCRIEVYPVGISQLKTLDECAHGAVVDSFCCLM